MDDQFYTSNTQPKSRWIRYCCGLCGIIGLILSLIVLLLLIGGNLYLIYRPEAPKFAIDNVSVKGMSLKSLSSISPEVDVSIKADNVNKIGIYYEKNNTVEMFYKDDQISNGLLPTFYQPKNNVTEFNMVLNGNNVVLPDADQKALVNDNAVRNVTLTLKLKTRLRFKVGFINMGKVEFMIECNMTVDELTEQAKIVDKNCWKKNYNYLFGRY